MKIIAVLLVGVLLCPIGLNYCFADQDEADMLGDAVMGGLLGAGAGAAIGSASGNCGKGAAMGAGIGAIGGALLGAMKRGSQRSRDKYYDRDRKTTSERDRDFEEDKYERQKKQKEAAKDDTYSKPGVTRKVVREYDENGNVISENEVYYEDEE